LIRLAGFLQCNYADGCVRQLRIFPESLAAILIFTARLDRADPNADALLSADEKLRASRFVRPRDRARFVAARSLLRRSLGSVVGLAGKDIVFGYEATGRPYLVDIAAAPDFNVSHSDDVVLIAISRVGRIGVDIEAVRPMEDLQGLAGQMMHPVEWDSFIGLPADQRTAHFFQLWTRKEALLKASGVGLSLDPRSVLIGLAASDEDISCKVGSTPCVLRTIAAPDGFAAAICVPECGYPQMVCFPSSQASLDAF
jgi:4'-phosphopantetheinyl transferase